MQMRASRLPAFTGRMTDGVALFYMSSQRHAAFLGNMQVENVPAGAFISIAVQVQYRGTGTSPDYHAIRNSDSRLV